jgi:hypothetical protein
MLAQAIGPSLRFESLIRCSINGSRPGDNVTARSKSFQTARDCVAVYGKRHPGNEHKRRKPEFISQNIDT